jgi:septal ring factor EnvC (AmiA/AmiB activator)
MTEPKKPREIKRYERYYDELYEVEEGELVYYKDHALALDQARQDEARKWTDKIAEYHNALEGKKQEVYRLEAELADHKKNHNSQAWGQTLNKRMDQIRELEARLAQALEALNAIYQECGKNPFYEHVLTPAEYSMVESVLTNPDNQRMVQRERLREVVIHNAKFYKSHPMGMLQEATNNLLSAVEVLEAHEKGGV